MSNDSTAAPGAAYVSAHGGHSREFCLHAQDALESVVKGYIDKGFKWVGLTEHMPPPEDRFLYPDEVEAGFTAETRYRQFAAYITQARRLQKKYQHTIELLIGFETETYTGSGPYIQTLRHTFHPDYMVGSVHHVGGLCFDYSQRHYHQCIQAVGGIEPLYKTYFDLQLDMMETLKPAVVGHFDLIRIYDPNYRERLKQPSILAKIRRNLECIRANDLLLELNVRALVKGADEPYVSAAILKEALALNISMVPGDDSHGVDTVGKFIPEGIQLLERYGFDTHWRKPKVFS